MIKLRIEKHPSFRAFGQKTWISGQDNEQFAVFWASARENGLTDTLRKVSGSNPGPVTGSHLFGISCVEKDPNDRAFFFFIAAEAPEGMELPDKLEEYHVPACEWAVFENSGNTADALIAAEMYAFMEWLPASAYEHANAPELEGYPAHHSTVEFWLPVRPKKSS